ncbi:3'-5' exonuclease [Actinoallomurus sp. NPDC050550]|uniref:3'-5' exonuclease n=1 Tax=Actinoallomurus sp. NPDC050550 TaxID=3154937 RepID=UPI0033CA9118
MADGSGTTWKDAPLVALDLEGTGAQDRGDEAILEIAVVPIAGGRPSLDDAYTTLINPGRPVPRRPWISPGLADKALAEAPTLAEVEPELAARLDTRIIVGHNIGVDWRLLHRRCPDIQPASLIDTLRLARRARPGDKRNSLTALLDHYELTDQVTRLAPNSRPHRAIWDTIGVALLITALIDDLRGGDTLTLRELQRFAELPRTRIDRSEPEQLPLLDL